MLKVVGASWLKTRVSTYILIGAGLLAVGSLFLAEMERPQFDGNYCATAYWSKKSGFRVEFWGQRNDLEMVPHGAARVCYKDTTFDNGWSQIEIETQSTYPDKIQAFAAGILEGAMTWKHIHNQWTNTIVNFCDHDDDSKQFCTWLRNLIRENFNTVKLLSDVKGKHDHYWYQVRLFYYQLEGLEFGWRKGVKRSRSGYEIPFEDFLLLNAMSDIRDLKVYYDNFVVKSAVEQANDSEHLIGKASMMLKVVEQDNGLIKLLFGHSSDGGYSSMLRLLKKYNFNYHFNANPNTHIIPGTNIFFTGYPGILSSMDDFYVTKGRHNKLIISGVGIYNSNIELWKNINVERSTLLAARIMAANRLATSGKTHARIMSRDPHTGIKQWLLIDLKQLKQFNNDKKDNEIVNNNSNIKIKSNEIIDNDAIIADVKQKNGIIWLTDQLPGRLHSEDITNDLLSEGFIDTNGYPYFQETRETGKVNQVDENAEKVDAIISSINDISKILKSRAFRGEYHNDNQLDHNYKAFGNIDVKLLEVSHTGDLEFNALAGPLFLKEVKQQHHQQQIGEQQKFNGNLIEAEALIKENPGPFKWSNNDYLKTSHNGHPDLFNFDNVSPKWAWT